VRVLQSGLRLRRVFAAAGAVVLVAAGCGGGGDTPSASTDSIVEQLRGRASAVDRVRPYASVVEAMPQVTFVVDGDREFTISDLYVTGRIVDVSPGAGFSWTTDDVTDAEVRNQFEFNASEAWVSTLRVTVEVARSIAGPGVSPNPDQIVFGLSLQSPVDIESARLDLMGMGQVALLLVQDTPVYDYDPSLWAVVEDGAFLGSVTTDGSIGFPLLTAGNGGLVPQGLTVDQLEAGPGDAEILLETLESGEVVRSS